MKREKIEENEMVKTIKNSDISSNSRHCAGWLTFVTRWMISRRVFNAFTCVLFFWEKTKHHSRGRWFDYNLNLETYHIRCFGQSARGRWCMFTCINASAGNLKKMLKCRGHCSRRIHLFWVILGKGMLGWKKLWSELIIRQSI